MDEMGDPVEIRSLMYSLMKLGLYDPVHQHPHEILLPSLNTAASEGCVAAQRYIEGLELYKSIGKQGVRLAVCALESAEVSKIHEMEEQIIFDLAKLISIDTNIPVWTRIMYLGLCKISSTVLKRLDGSTVSELDKSARMCQLYVKFKMSEDSSALPELLEFAGECIKKYPDEPFFYIIQGLILLAIGKDVEFAARFNILQVKYQLFNSFSIALEKFPKNLNILFTRAMLLKFLEKNAVEEQVEAWKEYLKYADKGDRIVPEFWYEIGAAAMNKFIKRAQNTLESEKDAPGYKAYVRVLKKCKNAYKNGEEGEKHMLPCYSQSRKSMAQIKGLLQNMIVNLEVLMKDNLGENKVVWETITQHRSILLWSIFPEFSQSEVMNLLQLNWHKECLMLMDMKYDWPEFKANPETDELKPVFINDMKARGTYIGRVIKLTSIEPVAEYSTGSSKVNGTFVCLAVEDADGDVMKVQIMNYDHEKISPDGKNIQEILGLGCKLSIKNPYVQHVVLDKDRKLFILLDNPATSLVLHPEERIERFCQYCLVENATLKCGKCQKVKYCDKFCQQKDWKVFKHRTICFPDNVEEGLNNAAA